MNDPFVLDKQRVRRAFNRAAQGYDAAAQLQREVGDRMLERLDLFRVEPATILDAGSGTGRGASALARRYPKAQIVELDLAPAMLRTSRSRQPAWAKLLSRRARRHYLCADQERIALRDASVDLLWSNLSFQWAASLQNVFLECLRVLKPGGLLLFSTFGPDTLRELRDALADVDEQVHVNRFIDMHDIGDLLIQCGLADPVMDMEQFTLTYADAHDLMRELKAIGAHNGNARRPRGPTGRQSWARALARYERLRDRGGKLPASYEVIYGHAWKPQPRLGPGGRRVIDLKAAKIG